MNLIAKVIRKIRIESRFLIEQKYGLRKPRDAFSISKSILKKYLSDSPVIIDCGAHTGGDSVDLAKIFPTGMIHSFEPVPGIFTQLKKNTRKFPNIKTYQVALSSENGFSKMFVSSGASDASSSLLTPTGHLNDHPDVHFDESIEVRTLTLDSWAAENNIARVDFLWLDMQGFEFKMLEASAEILPTVKSIHAEVSLKETYKDAPLFWDFKNWLGKKGFAVVAEAIPAGTDMGNVLFVRNNT